MLRERSGTVFPRRFSAEEILDDEAFAGRIRHTRLNPADARLVAEYHDWPGLVAWPLLNAGREFKRFNRRDFARVLRKAEPGLEPRREDFIETETLELAPLPAGVDAQEIEREVKEEEKNLCAKKPHVLGRDAILEQPFDGQRQEDRRRVGQARPQRLEVPARAPRRAPPASSATFVARL